jgi:carbonic anhydrase/acetyltransferase-like protein (isoleucine patch superfamily)
VAEGTVVKMNQEIPDNAVVAGNPAKVVRGVEERDKTFWLNGKQIYIDLAAKYLKIGMHAVKEK